MALDFPSNPVNGQIYNNFYYDSSTSAWRSIGSVYAPNYLKNATFSTTATTGVPLTAQGIAAQSANLQEWKNSSGVILANVDSSGTLNNTSISTTNLYLNRTDSLYEGGQINFRRSTDNTDYWYIDVYGNTATPSLRMLAGSQTNMQLDSYGRLSIPYQPSFHAYPTDTSWSNSSANTDLTIFSNTRHNIGNYYNTSTGRFTAPIAGMYFMSVSIFKHTTYNNPSNTYWGLYINGSGVNVTNHGINGQDGGQSVSGVYYLAVGDYVTVRHNSTITSWGGQFASFNGHLLG